MRHLLPEIPGPIAKIPVAGQGIFIRIIRLACIKKNSIMRAPDKSLPVMAGLSNRCGIHFDDGDIFACSASCFRIIGNSQTDFILTWFVKNMRDNFTFCHIAAAKIPVILKRPLVTEHLITINGTGPVKSYCLPGAYNPIRPGSGPGRVIDNNPLVHLPAAVADPGAVINDQRSHILTWHPVFMRNLYTPAIFTISEIPIITALFVFQKIPVRVGRVFRAELNLFIRTGPESITLLPEVFSLLHQAPLN